MLLNHRAGLGDVEDYGWDKPQTGDDALSRYVRPLKSEKLLSNPVQSLPIAILAMKSSALPLKMSVG